MLDRQKLETLLSKRFPGATTEQIAAAANAIMAMIRTDGNGAEKPGIATTPRMARTASSLPLPPA